MTSWIWNGGFAYSGAKLGSITIPAAATLTVPTPFQAMLQGDMQFSGSCTDQYGQAQIEGQIEGLTVRFVKRYVRSSFGSGTKDPVYYEGVLSPDRTRIDGTWIIHGKCLGIIPLKTFGTWFVVF
jgi:hypothetical protein